MALKALNATTAVYVGDTAKDKVTTTQRSKNNKLLKNLILTRVERPQECALAAGCDFIGVGYGFEDMGEASAASVEELSRMLAEKLDIPRP